MSVRKQRAETVQSDTVENNPTPKNPRICQTEKYHKYEGLTCMKYICDKLHAITSFLKIKL